MNELEKRVRVKLQGEISAEDYRRLEASISGLALGETVQLTSTEVRPPKPEQEPLVVVPEELKGKLGGLSFTQYKTRLEELGRDKSFIMSSWNKLSRIGAIYSPAQDADPQDIAKLVSDDKSTRRYGYVSSKEAVEQGYFADLDKLATDIESGRLENAHDGIGPGISGTWAGLIEERIKSLQRANTEN